MLRAAVLTALLTAAVWSPVNAAPVVLYGQIDRLSAVSMFPNEFGVGSPLTLSFDSDLSGSATLTNWSFEVGRSSASGLGEVLYESRDQTFRVTFDSSRSINRVRGGTFTYFFEDERETFGSSWVIAEYGSFSTAASRFTVGFQHIDTQGFFEIAGPLSGVSQGPIPEPSAAVWVAAVLFGLTWRRRQSARIPQVWTAS
jgi:hypothetical protein